MTKPATCLFAISVLLFSVGCNSESGNNVTSTGSTSQQADSTRLADTSSIVNTNQQTGMTTPQPPAESTTKGDASFHKLLTHKNISFDITAKGKGSLQQLTIKSSGLSEDNRNITLQTEPVVGAEVGDLNADSYPELLVFTQSAGSGSYGKVIAYSVNNGKSMSQVTFPGTGKNPQINKGYMGHDRFTIKNKQLTQTFPLYKDGDQNSGPTGKTRTVTYKLVDGEASRTFIVDQVKG
jgi:hypothetical protein